MLKVYHYKNGEKAVFINDEKRIIPDKVAKVIEAYVRFSTELYEDANIKRIPMVRNSPEDYLKMASMIEIEEFILEEFEAELTFFLYKNKILGIEGHIGQHNADKLRQFDLNDLYEQIKTGHLK